MMDTHADKTQEKKSKAVSNDPSQIQIGGESTVPFVDNRPETIVQRNIQEIANNSPQAKKAAQFQAMTAVNQVVVQRRLHTGNETFDEQTPLLGASPFIKGLVDQPNDFYAPAAVRAEPNVNEAPILEPKYYLLGESHGDGTWGQRTQPWPEIPKLMETLRFFEEPWIADDPVGVVSEFNAETAAGYDPNVGGLEGANHASVGFAETGLGALNTLGPSRNDLANAIQHKDAVEADATADAVDKAIAAEPVSEWENTFADQVRILAKHAKNLVTVISSYHIPLLQNWSDQYGDTSKVEEIEQIWLLVDLVTNHPGWESLRSIAEDRRWQPEAYDREHDDVQALLRMMSDRLRNMVGAPPLAANPVDAAAGLASSKPIREAEMARRILAESPPLLVQMGTEHVATVAGLVGDQAVQVPTGVDFNELTRKSARVGEMFEGGVEDVKGFFKSLWK